MHTVIGTASNVSDVPRAGALLSGDASAALGDESYQGVEKPPENQGKSVPWHIPMKRSKHKALPQNTVGRMLEKLVHRKASVRAKVAHSFYVIKNLFRHRKARYRGLSQNTVQAVRRRQSGVGRPAIYDHCVATYVLSAARRKDIGQFAEKPAVPTPKSASQNAGAALPL